MPETIHQTLERLAPGVEPVEGEPGRFRVRSKTRAEWYHSVDLTEVVPNGVCSCEAFSTFGKLTKLKRGEPCGVNTICEHIRRVRMYVVLVAVWNQARLLETGQRRFVEMMQRPLPRLKKNNE